MKKGENFIFPESSVSSKNVVVAALPDEATTMRSVINHKFTLLVSSVCVIIIDNDDERVEEK